jgi:hypothetical protein
MKRGLYLFVCVIILSTFVHAEVDSIYDYLKKMDNQYVVAVGAQGKSGDSFAATDIVVSLKQNFAVDVEATVENMITPNINKILVGHPCDNSLIKLSCEQWPYDPGQALIKVMENDLIVAGSTVDDTRRAAKIIANADLYPQLKTTKEILVLGNTLQVKDLKLVQIKKPKDFVCGDMICDIGEKLSCAIDCEQKNCFTVCQENNATNAFCRDPPSNPNLPFCEKGEHNQGQGLCAQNQICCCQQSKEEPENPSGQPQLHPPKGKGFFQAIWDWFKELFSVLF